MLSLSLPREVYHWLRQTAKAGNSTARDVIADILRDYLADASQFAPVSAPPLGGPRIMQTFGLDADLQAALNRAMFAHRKPDRFAYKDEVVLRALTLAHAKAVQPAKAVLPPAPPASLQRIQQAGRRNGGRFRL